jgi:hypothetical protein
MVVYLAPTVRRSAGPGPGLLISTVEDTLGHNDAQSFSRRWRLLNQLPVLTHREPLAGDVALAAIPPTSGPFPINRLI